MTRRQRIALKLLGPAPLGLVLVVVMVWIVTYEAAPWVVMVAMAAAEFFVLKVLTVAGLGREACAGRLAGYLLAWPGMNARAFLGPRDGTYAAAAREWGIALLKLAGGLGALGWAVRHVGEAAPALVAWVGLVGLIFTLHFGVLHIGSCLWRRAGVAAPPIMRAPIAATSLTEFWSERWNVAFADVARRFVFRPLARKWGAVWASATVFLVSGLVHETVISLPARGGWGGPTLYFLVQAAGAWLERTGPGRALGLGRGARGWAWTVLLTAAPLPLLVTAPFVERVILPMFFSLKGVLP